MLVVHAPAGAAGRGVDRHRWSRAAPVDPGAAAGLRHGRDHRRPAPRDAGEGRPRRVFATPAQAVRGFQHLVRDRRNRAAARELPPSTVLSVAPDRTAVRRLFAQVRRAGRLALFQDEALDVLAAYGIPAVPTRSVAQAEDAPRPPRCWAFRWW